MAIRTIEYTVTADGISPIAVQQGGVQGEHNATEVHFLIDSKFFDTIEEQAGQNAVYYHFEAYNGIGNRISTELRELEGNSLTYPIENSLTRYGGSVRVILAITVAEKATAKMITYSYPAILKLKGKPSGNEEGDREVKEVSALVLAARLSADTAIKAAEDAGKRCNDADSFAETAGEYAHEAEVSAVEADASATCASEHVTFAESAAKKAEENELNSRQNKDEAERAAIDAEGYRDEAEKFAQNIQSTVEEATDILNSAKNDFCNALKGTASGTLVRLDDVSPIEHTLDVEVSVPIQTATGIAAPVKLPNVKWCRVLPIGCSYEELIFKMTSGRSFSVRLDEDDTYFEPDEQGITATIVGGTLTIEGYLDDGSKVKVFQQHTIENGDAIAEVLESDGYNDLQVEYKYVATLTRTGKNLLTYQDINFDLSGVNFRTENGALVLNGTSKGEIYASNTVYNDKFSINLPAGDYTFSLLNNNDVDIVSFQVRTIAGTGLFSFNGAKGLNSKQFTLNSPTTICIGMYIYSRTYDNAVFEIQLEKGKVNTEDIQLTPFSEVTQYEVNGDGTVDGVISSDDTIHLTANGVSKLDFKEISVTYNRDINKAFAELITAVQTLGGTI